jgi:hypothetical protein
MAKKFEGSVGAARFGEGFVRKDKETREDDRRLMGRTRHEGGEYNSVITGRRSHVRRHGGEINRRDLVESGKKIYVQVPHEQIVSKTKVVRA